MKSAVSEKDYDSRSNTWGGNYMGTGKPAKMGTLRESFGNAVPQKSKVTNKSPRKIG
jgi:hypothetical protein